MPRRMPRQYRALMGGGQEFQEQTPYSPLPDDLWTGPPPQTQTRPGGADLASNLIDPGLALAPYSAQSQSKWAGYPPEIQALLYGIQRRGEFIMTNGVVGLAPILIRAAEQPRIYFIIQNTSAANSLIVGVGMQPTLIAGGFTGIQLPALASYEPSVTPQDDIWVLGSAAGTNWCMAVSVR